MVSVKKKFANSCVWGPIHIVGLFDKKGPANRPKMHQFQKFQSISCTKSKLKGGSFMKNCQLMYLVPLNAGCLEQLRVSSNWPKI